MAAASATEIRILDVRARVTGPRLLLCELEALFPRLPSWETGPAHEMAVTVEIQRDTSRRTVHRIQCDGVSSWAVDDPQEVLATLEWVINTAAVERLRDRYLLFHAGAVAQAGEGFLFPAASGRGKTTLVAGLVAAGCQHLTDEVAVVDPVSLQLAPFARSLCVKESARPFLVPVWPGLAKSVPRSRFGTEVYYLRPNDDAWLPRPVPVRYVVIPRYVPKGQTSLTPISRSSALINLLGQSFNGRVLGGRTVDATVKLLRAARCYTLTVGHLDRAVDLLLRLPRS
jgi:hypothetical protein